MFAPKDCAAVFFAVPGDALYVDAASAARLAPITALFATLYAWPAIWPPVVAIVPRL